MNNLPPVVRQAACISCGSESIEFLGESIEFLGEEEYWNQERTELVICLMFRCDKCEIEWSEPI